MAAFAILLAPLLLVACATGDGVDMEQPIAGTPDPVATTGGAPVLRASWATDFSRTSIDFSEIMTGGPPKDGIPAIDSPEFETVVDGDVWLDDAEPVQVVDINGDVRAYPVQVMIWHELVNDTVGGEPVVITF